jgi:hypothetical protein
VRALAATGLAISSLLLVANGTASNSTEKHGSNVTRNLLCIHHYEGSWQDGGKPYYGGLQMDLSFQRSYGYKYVNVKLYGRIVKRMKIYFMDIWGTANHWPIKAQLEAGRNAVKVRGYYPWPNTARFCGLL